MEKRAGELAVFRHEVNTEVWQKKQVLEKRKENPTSECENLSKFVSCFVCVFFLATFRRWFQKEDGCNNQKYWKTMLSFMCRADSSGV